MNAWDLLGPGYIRSMVPPYNLIWLRYTLPEIREPYIFWEAC